MQAPYMPVCPGLSHACKFYWPFLNMSEVFGLTRATPSVVHFTQCLRFLHQGKRITIHNQDIVFRYGVGLQDLEYSHVE